MKKYKFKIIRITNSLFVQEWDKLWNIAENANIHNSYSRFLACINTYLIKDYEIYTCYKDGELVAVWPVSVYKRFGIKVIGSLGNNFIYNTSFLMKNYNHELLSYFFINIIEKRDLYITRIDDKVAEILKHIFPKMLFSVMGGVPFLDVNNEPHRFIPLSSQKKIKNILKKNSDKLVFKIYEDKLQEYLKIMFSIEQKSSKKLRAKDLFSKKINRVYYKNLINYCKSFVSIAILYYQNNPIAYSFNLKPKNTLCCNQTAYLSEFKIFMPGKIIAFNLLESLRKSTIKRIDFGAGLSSFKREFTPDYYLLYDLYFSSNALVMLWWRMINCIRRIKKIVFIEKFTRDSEFLFKTL